MSNKLLVLKLFLDALSEKASIDSINDRIRLQKAIYLGQRFGMDLGYRFSWYVRGPYSTGLAADYYSLADSLERITTTAKEYCLQDSHITNLKQCRELLKKPNDVTLETHQWYELLASVHYLLHVSKQEEVKTKDTIAQKKPQLAKFFDKAVDHLANYGPS